VVVRIAVIRLRGTSTRRRFEGPQIVDSTDAMRAEWSRCVQVEDTFCIDPLADLSVVQQHAVTRHDIVPFSTTIRPYERSSDV